MTRNQWLWTLLAGISGVVLTIFAYWLFVLNDNSPVLAFKGRAFLTLDGNTASLVIRLDEKPLYKISGIVWLRQDCLQNVANQYIQIDGHPRFDVGIHPIAFPGHLGPVPDKWRPLLSKPEPLRDFTYGLVGKARFWETVVSVCHGHTVTVDTPVFDFEAVP